MYRTTQRDGFHAEVSPSYVCAFSSISGSSESPCWAARRSCSVAASLIEAIGRDARSITDGQG